MEAGRCVWSRLGERGETRCQPAEQEQDFAEGRASEGGSTHDGWIQIGIHPMARDIVSSQFSQGGVGASSRP
jgi:hypothetical protein